MATTTAVSTNTIATAKRAIAFNVPVVPSLVVADYAAWTVNSLPPTVITVTDSQHIVLTYAAAVIATNPWVLPANSPAVRTQSGGFVAAASGIF